MSLDFYLLYNKERDTEAIHNEVWDDFDDLEFNDEGDYRAFDTNITHNLGEMADKAGIYECLWEPLENNYKKAKDITPFVMLGLRVLKNNPKHFKQYSADNGWGTYEQFIPWLEELIEALIKHPNASIRVWR